MSEERDPRTGLTPDELAARNRRNVWLALALVAFVLIVGAVTVIRISETGMGPDQEFYWHADD